MDEIEVTFLRHGRSRADDECVHEGRYDSPLTDVGRAQIRARAESWRSAGVRFDRIVCSPLRRAAESAAIVGEVLDVAVEEDASWLEMDNGRAAGVPYDVAAARFPKPSFRNPYQPHFDTGESDWDLHARAALSLQRVVARGVGRYLVVAHGGVLNAALRCLVGAPPPVNGQGIGFAFGDAGYLSATCHPDRHAWIVRELRQG